MSDVYFIVIPVVIVVVILKLCLIFWRIWLYQKRRERVYMIQNQRQACRQPARTRQQGQQGQTTARVVGVERSVGPDGFTQRTSYVVNQPGLPARQITRTIVIRPNDNRRPNDPNLPPSYDHAVTGRDKSVKVESDTGADLGPLPTIIEPSAPPIIAEAPPADISGIPPPEYSRQALSAPPEMDESSCSSEETRLLLP